MGAGAEASTLKSGLECLMVWNVLSGWGGHCQPPDSWGADRAMVRCCLPMGVAFLASWIISLSVQILLPWVKSHFPRPESKCFIQESEVRSQRSSPGAFCRMGRAGSPRTQIKSREQGRPFLAAWGLPCPAVRCHCPAPALPGAALSPPQGCWAYCPP